MALGLVNTERHKYFCTWWVLRSANPVVKEVQTTELTEDQEVQMGMTTLREVQKLTPKMENLNLRSANSDREVQIKESRSVDLGSGVSPLNNPPYNTIHRISIEDLDTSITSSKYKKKEKTFVLRTNKKERKSTEKPEGTNLVSETLNIGHEFPYEGDDSLADSFIWYWAVKRFEKHGLDMILDGKTIGKYKMFLSGNLDRIAKNDWNNVKNYIDWYLTINNDWMRSQCGWGFNFLVSTSSLNRYLSAYRNRDMRFYTEDTRQKATGKWIKD